MASMVKTVFKADMRTPDHLVWPSLEVSYLSKSCIEGKLNEDAMGLVNIDDNHFILAIADGVGGHAYGYKAANAAIESVVQEFEGVSSCDDLSPTILRAFDRANKEVLDIGAGSGTTLLVVEVTERCLRSYHAGDSGMMVVGGKGKLKHFTIGHSSFELGMEAGLVDGLDPQEYHLRNELTNMVGSKDMRIEVGPKISLRPRDLVIMASDGLLDNLDVDDFLKSTPERDPQLLMDLLYQKAVRQMEGEDESRYSKPDDLSIIVFKPTS